MTDQFKPTAYILKCEDRGYFLVGPFADPHAAARWATEHNPADDPRWQVLELDTPPYDPPVVKKPVEASLS